MATARAHSPQFACGGLIIYTDVRGEGRGNRSRAALSDKCRSTCGSGYGSELTRRGGGDHGTWAKTKEGLGSESTNEAPIAPQAARLDRCRAVRSEYMTNHLTGGPP
eukprot:scaffold10266_cov58-Phaeocystis_antarctica.AAC.1